MSIPLVSIVTPCYNGEEVVHRLLDSILSQTYSNIELIIVDDGSTDKTKEIIFSYKKLFLEKGIDLIYVHQVNTGLAGAINTGLRKVNGDYICWPDADDYLHIESLAKRVEILEKNTQFGVVTSDASIRSIHDLGGCLRLAGSQHKDKFHSNQFEALLSGNSMFIPGTHMARASFFFETQPDKLLFPCRRGQNWQMLLPLYYKYERYYLDEPLYNYIIYDSSMSQGDDSEEQQLYRCDEHEEIIIETLNSMNIEPDIKAEYINETRIRYVRKKLTIAFYNHNKVLVKELYKILSKENKSRRKEFMYLLAIRNKYIYKIFSVIFTITRDQIIKR